MKRVLTICVIASALAACSSTKTVNPDEAIRNQTLNTTFSEDGVKIITDCAWYKPFQRECDIVAIEATASTWTNGATTVQVNEARKVARAEAFSNVSNFLNKKITSSQVVTTVAKHMEKAKDQFNNGNTKESDMTDKEAKTISARENSNDTARTVTRTISEHSESVLRGFRVIKEEKVGQQELSVTIRWDKDSDRAAAQLRKRFGN